MTERKYSPEERENLLNAIALVRALYASDPEDSIKIVTERVQERTGKHFTQWEDEQ